MTDDRGGVRSGLTKLGAGLSVGRSVSARRRRLVGFIVPFAFGAALTVGVYFTIADRRRSDKLARFEEIVSEMAAALQANLDLQFETLHGIPPFFAASDNVTRSDFSVFVRSAMRRYSSIYVFQWLPRVTAADRVAFEALLRAEGYQGSGLREIVDAENARPAADRPEYFPVLYGEPAIQIVFGLDLASHPEQGIHYRRACTANGMVATPPLSLIEDPPDVLSVIAISSVRLRGTASDEPCDGLAMMILRVNPVVTRAIDEERLREFSIVLTAENSAGVIQPVFQNLEGSAAPGEDARWPAATREIGVSDRTWTLQASPSPGTPLAPGGSPWFVLPVGLLLSILIGYGVAASVTITGLRKSVDAALELGQYKLGRKLGAGGMGVVYEARHRMLARPAAIKLIRPDAPSTSGESGRAGRSSESLMARFEKEAQATSQLESPHTISVYDFGKTEDGAFYYVMEYLHGMDLESLVERFGTLPPARCVYLLHQICTSLAEAHHRGLVHRDIKPANIFVCRQGLDYDFVKVLDFGLVKATKAPEASLALTQAGAILGTPAFLAPETIMNTVSDARADIYAVGCVAYWMLTGENVFPAQSVAHMLVRHVQDAPPAPSSRCDADIPAELEELILLCLTKDPDGRPQSVTEISRVLSDCHTADSWGSEDAARWWSAHERDLEPGAART